MFCLTIPVAEYRRFRYGDNCLMRVNIRWVERSSPKAGLARATSSPGRRLLSEGHAEKKCLVYIATLTLVAQISEQDYLNEATTIRNMGE